MVYVVYICFTHHRLIKPVGIKKDDTEKHSFLNIFVANNGRHAKNQDNILEKNIKFFFFLGLVCSNHLVYLSEAFPDHIFFVFPDSSMIFGM
jgi:hypothetical protein